MKGCHLVGVGKVGPFRNMTHSNAVVPGIGDNNRVPANPRNSPRRHQATKSLVRPVPNLMNTDLVPLAAYFIY
jgi:hypothetical protein